MRWRGGWIGAGREGSGGAHLGRVRTSGRKRNRRRKRQKVWDEIDVVWASLEN